MITLLTRIEHPIAAPRRLTIRAATSREEIRIQGSLIALLPAINDTVSTARGNRLLHQMTIRTTTVSRRPIPRSIIALLAGIDLSIPAHGQVRLDLAVMGTAVPIDDIAVVALLRGLEHAIAAARKNERPQVTILRAAVLCRAVHLPIVTLLTVLRLHDPIPATHDQRFEFAIVRATVAVRRVAIIALLAGIESSVTTDRNVLAGRGTPITRRAIPRSVVALFVDVHDAISATHHRIVLERAGARTAIAVRRVAIIALLAGIDPAVPAHRNVLAERGASVAGRSVPRAIVTLLPLFHDPVAAARRKLATRGTPITRNAV